jgi:molybdate-binding protein/DNA-binding transcriptional ArsR family regulator
MYRSQDSALFKILAHPERTAILRRLMANQATLTQLGEFFHKTPAHIRHHLKVLEQAGLVEFVEARPVQGGPEKYYHATQQALFIHQAVLPEIPKEKISITIGSMDAGVSYLARFFAQKQAPFFLLPLPLSSLDGLIALRQGLCQMSTCHLIDPQSEEYNRPFIRHLFPGQAMALVRVYWREEGLLVKPGNPLGIKSLEDLVRPDIRFVNREAGSGVRQWLDLRLKRPGIQPKMVRGYSHVVHSHPEVARTIQEGKADVGIGIVAAAREFGLGFIALFDEPYEIAVPLSNLSDERYTPFFEYLNSGEIRSILRNLDGYIVPQNCGEIEVIS